MTENFFIFAAYATITGGITCAVIVPFEKIIYSNTSASFMKFIMCFCLLSFVIPSYMFFFIKEGINESVFGNGIPVIQVKNEIVEKIYIFLDEYNIGKFVTVFWSAGIVIYLIYTFITYSKFIYWIKENSIPAYGKYSGMFESINKTGSKKRRILLISNSLTQPFTTGIRKKYIVIPDVILRTFSDEEIRLILIHEITHAERRDVPIKMFLEVMNSLNWFNPIFYIVKQRFNFWTEVSCDENLSSGFTKLEKIKYVKAMFKVFEINSKNKSNQGVYFASKKVLNIKRRFEAIMENKSKKSKVANIIVSFMALCVFYGAGYVAKEADYAVYGIFGVDKEITDAEYSSITIDSNIEFESNNNSDELLVNDISIFSEADTNHIHQWSDTKAKKHVKNSDGSCDTTYYYAQQCDICDKIKLEEAYKSEHYNKCPH